MPNYKTLETERLILKPSIEEDGGFINRPKWTKYIGNRNIKTVDRNVIQKKSVFYNKIRESINK